MLCGTHLARSDAGLLGERRGRVLGGSGWSGAHWEPGRAGWPVQQESTATGADLTGRARTSWDGDLHRRTAVDVLPADGMQEVRGSNPLSSTPGQTDKFEILSPPFTGLVQQQNTATQRHDVPVRRPGSGSGTRRSCWHDLLKAYAKTDPECPDQEERSFPTLFDPCTGAVAWRLLAGDSCRRRNGSGQLCFRRAAVLPAGGLRRWRSIGAPGAPARWQGADTARRGATWRRWGCAAAAPSACQAAGGAPA